MEVDSSIRLSKNLMAKVEMLSPITMCVYFTPSQMLMVTKVANAILFPM